MSLCSDCPSHSLCKRLCPEAELYINQDYNYTRETIFDALDIDVINKKAKLDIRIEERKRILEMFHKWPKKQQIATLLDANVSRAQIAQIVGITRENLRKTISKIKKEKTIKTSIEE